jgi:transposase InsO family protein
MFVTDNAKQFRQAVKWLKEKYGIPHIFISPYNSQANGKIENGHFSLRQALYKATSGNPAKWFWFFMIVLWADRITVRKGTGCSPYFMVTGAHPVLPLDIEEATWLVEYPGRVLTDSELIGLGAQSLAKHVQHVEEMRKRVDHAKRVSV